MVYNTTFLNNASDGLAGLYVGTANAMPEIMPWIFFFEFVIILIVGAGINKIKVGSTNVITWCAVSSVATTTSVFFFSFVTGLVSLALVSTCVSITIGFAFWYFMSNLD